jgi:glycosyltransferase involved in cell wall biosynthesis
MPAGRPRVAIATGALRVPPTYFVLQHAQRLADRIDAEVFARVAEVRDDSLGVPVHDATPAGGGWARRTRRSLLRGTVQRRAIEAFAPALVHQHFGTWAAPAVAAARHGGVPLVTTLHGYDVFAALSASGLGDRTRARSVRAAFGASARLLAVSSFLAERAIAAGAPAERVQVHYQGIDTDFFTPGDDAAREPFVVFVGALAPRKGPQDLIRASLGLAASAPHRLVLVGAGPSEAALRELSSGAGHIDFAGSLDRTAVRGLIRRARVLVLPTQRHEGWQEAAGLVLLEAQSCGTPVVTYRSGGAPEMIDDGRTGYVVPERDQDALGDAVGRLLRMPDAEHREMARTARRFVVEQRSLASSAQELAAHYGELLGRTI